MILRAALAMTFVVAIACGPNAPSLLSAPIASATPRPGVDEARYGRLAISTDPGASCDVEVRITPGQVGESPVGRLTGIADAAGALAWTYAAPPLPSQRASYAIACSTSAGAQTRDVPFEITLAPLRAQSFTAHVVASPTDAASDQSEPSLVPLRDATVRHLRSELPKEWRAATRGLGTLAVVDEPADILVRVIAARDSSVHVGASDGSQEVRVYVADQRGTKDVENLAAIALHELGHIWCCSGAGTVDGHWAVAEADGELEGIDRFGLMNHPVTCLTIGAVISCPNRFSRRELTAFGFTNIPPPPPDPCLTQARAIESRIAGYDTTLATLRSELTSIEARIAEYAARIRQIEATYGRTMPPDVYEEYTRLVAAHNALVVEQRQLAASYNAKVSERNTAVDQRNALAC